MKCKLYVITDGQYTKVGYAHDVLTRLSTLQVGNARELSVVYAAVPKKCTAKDAEKQAHYRLAAYRVRGEWFNCSPKLAAKVSREIVNTYSKET